MENDWFQFALHHLCQISNQKSGSWLVSVRFGVKHRYQEVVLTEKWSIIATVQWTDIICVDICQDNVTPLIVSCHTYRVSGQAGLRKLINFEEMLTSIFRRTCGRELWRVSVPFLLDYVFVFIFMFTKGNYSVLLFREILIYKF